MQSIIKYPEKQFSKFSLYWTEKNPEVDKSEQNYLGDSLFFELGEDPKKSFSRSVNVQTGPRYKISPYYTTPTFWVSAAPKYIG